jgi:tetratricopeptide (TPR) repeat protein
LADQFDLLGALAEFSEAVRLAPDAYAPHYNKGRVLVDLRRNEEAKLELQAAAEFDPHSVDSRYLLGLIEKQAGNTEESIRLLEKAVALEPNHPDALYLLGQGLLKRGDSVGAIARWRRVIEINPDHAEALYNLSRLLTKSDPEEAKRLQARFETLQRNQHITDRAQTLGNFALASAAARDWPQAIAQLKEGLQLCGDCSALPLLRKDLGLIYCRSGDLKNGLAELLEAQKLAPNDADIEQAIRMIQSPRETRSHGSQR